MSKKITFVLPGVSQKTVGGYKVVYELANRFVSAGYQVKIVYIIPFKSVESYGVNLKNYIFPKKEDQIKVDWFPLHQQISQRIYPFYNYRKDYHDKSDYIIATSYETAQWVIGLPQEIGKKIYLILHFEDWSGEVKAVEETWKAPFNKKIVIASWMVEKAKELKQEVINWRIGLDLKDLHITNPITKRNPYQVLIIYHPYKWKGFADGFQAFQIVKKEITEAKLVIFCNYLPPKEIREKYEYHIRPRLVDIYNSSSIYLAPSWAEGCHLPPLEAMACGCCVVATNVGSIPDFTINGKTALVSEPRNPLGLAENLKKVLQDRKLRIRIAQAGYNNIQKYTWEKAFQDFRKIITE